MLSKTDSGSTGAFSLKTDTPVGPPAKPEAPAEGARLSDSTFNAYMAKLVRPTPLATARTCGGSDQESGREARQGNGSGQDAGVPSSSPKAPLRRSKPSSARGSADDATRRAERALTHADPADADDVAAKELRSGEQTPAKEPAPADACVGAFAGPAERRAAEPTVVSRQTEAQAGRSGKPSASEYAQTSKTPAVRDPVAKAGGPSAVKAVEKSTEPGTSAVTTGVQTLPSPPCGEAIAPQAGDAAPTVLPPATGSKAVTVSAIGETKAGPGVTLAKLAASGKERARLVQEESVSQQVAGGLAAALKQGGNSASLRLRPDELGSLHIDIHLGEDGLHASIRAASDSARQLLEDAVPTLRHTLEARGVRVERIDVSVAAEPLRETHTRDPAASPTDHVRGNEPWARDAAAGSAAEHSGQHQGGEESHAHRRHAGSDGRTDASDAGEVGETDAAEPRDMSGTPHVLLTRLGGSTVLRLDAVA